MTHTITIIFNRLITMSLLVLLLTKSAGLSSGLHDRTDDHHTSSSQVSPTIDVEHVGVAKRAQKGEIGISEILFNTTVDQRYVYEGEMVTLFSNVGGLYKTVSMYKSYDTYCVTWHFKDGTPKRVYMNPDYPGSAKMDRKGYVGILNVTKNDAGFYHFICDPSCELSFIQVIVLDSFAEEFKKITEMLNNQEDIMKQLANLTEEFKITKMLDNQRIMNHLESLTEETKKNTKRLHDQEDIMKYLGESHLATAQRITTILVIVIILLIIVILWFACYMWNMLKTSKKSLTEDQVEKGLYDLTVFMEKNLEKLTDDQTRLLIQKFLDVYLMFMKKNLEKLTDDQIKELIQKCLGAPLKNLDQLDRTEDHHTSSSQVSATIHPFDYSVNERLLEDETGGKENQKIGFSETSFIDTAAAFKISLPETKSSQHGQTERYMSSSKYFTENDHAGEPLLDP